MIDIHFGDNLEVLREFPDASFPLIYIDPPFNTGKVQARTQIRTHRDDDGDRVGFEGQTFRTTRLGTLGYVDFFDDYLEFLVPRLLEAYRLLTPTGSFFLHLDYREVHYAKVALDQIFGRACFQNEIIWAYDYGARASRRWSAKHDTVLWYTRDPRKYVFRLEEVDRIPYMAPKLIGAAKIKRGKTPTDTWWHTIVSPTGKEKTGYPTQKPLGILERLIKVHSEPGARVLDFFAGSGSLGDAADRCGRDAVLVDHHTEALQVMERRFSGRPVRWHGWPPPVDAAEEPTPEG